MDNITGYRFMCYKFRLCCILFLCLGLLVAGWTALHAQEKKSPKKEDDFKKEVTSLKKDVKILRTEIRKVRQTVSKLSKETKSLKDLQPALSELNSKLEAQIDNIKALSGEIYRVGSAQDDNFSKGSTNRVEMEQLSLDIQKNKQTIEDLEDEIRLLRAVQVDLQKLSTVPSPQKEETSFWEEVLHWKYWGQAACGIAFIALIIAL